MHWRLRYGFHTVVDETLFQFFWQPFLVQTDAYERGVGAILSQQDENGKDHSVAFFTQKLLPQEEPYEMVKKECLVI